MSIRQDYEKKIQEHINQWEADIEKLKAYADKAEADLKLKYYEEIEELRVKQRGIQEKLDHLRESGDDAWEDIKTGVELAWVSMQESIKSALSRFH
ncbi:MAG: hypothetical protein PVJ63_01970 [Thioalkalispiraceae bacterium]|jgi:hypothetical protein